MTDRAEIERLLNQTGRTLEGLPEEHSEEERTNALSTFVPWGEVICHQSDVIELLVGALRDALEERDAAIKEIPRECGYCKHFNDPPRIEEVGHDILFIYCEKECHNISGVNTGWKWRGVKKNGG